MYVHARGFTAEQKNCGKSGLGRRGPWALGLGPAFSKTLRHRILTFISSST